MVTANLAAGIQGGRRQGELGFDGQLDCLCTVAAVVRTVARIVTGIGVYIRGLTDSISKSKRAHIERASNEPAQPILQ